MTPQRIELAPAVTAVPAILASWLAVFRPCFTTPAWNRILVLVAGAVLSPGKRVPKLNAVLADPNTAWTSVTMAEWYGGQKHALEYVSGIAV